MRALVTIQKAGEITVIPNSDFLEAVRIMGWQCVAKKGEFTAGELGVYFEVDSFLPLDSRYEFLRASSYRDNEYNGQGFRIRTMKMRGQLSQGLFLHLSLFPELEGCGEGEDVTEKLGVRKWQIPETAGGGGTIIGERPFGIPASDEVRVQSAPELLDALRGRPYYITTKMDGTSGIVYYIDGKIGCCSRNKEIKDEADALYWLPVYRYGLREKLAAYGKDIVLTGEICGPGIQKNRLRLSALEWYVFDVMDWDSRSYVSYDRMLEICAALELPAVPLEERGDSFSYTQEELLEKARGKYPGGLDKEGIVVRDSRSPKDISFKALNNDALLKEKD
ncbi:MAG: 2'-5' RNA ligase [Gracilibacteraceae bacterium]|jgi:RNA ligase (TIGR02306 family)|nr:2'-5' RNA ligase [Gracilibacteraceae bacterium]